MKDRFLVKEKKEDLNFQQVISQEISNYSTADSIKLSSNYDTWFNHDFGASVACLLLQTILASHNH